LHPMRRVEVVQYNPDWPRMFEIETSNLRTILGAELVCLQHIGSTSIPGLAAKPIIDMLAEVKDINRLDSLNESLVAAGYTPKGEYGIAGRRYFFKGSEERHTYHIHAYAAGHPEIRRHLLFRDYLRAHPDAARRYAALKRSLAEQYPCNVDAYTDAKDDFIHEMDRLALAWDARNRRDD
jgi:GrpB-like predicted nucleotidyltransferase (UPF0157 family)